MYIYCYGQKVQMPPYVFRDPADFRIRGPERFFFIFIVNHTDAGRHLYMKHRPMSSRYCTKYTKFHMQQYHWVQSKRHRLWFSTKTCSCYSTKTHVNSMILILKLNSTSLSTTHILMYMFLNEVKFNLTIRITLFIWVFVEWQLHVFVENNNLWRFDCTQWIL